MNELVVIWIYNIVVFAGMLFLMVVVTQAMNDPLLRRNDSVPLQRARKNSFYGAGAYLLLTMCLQEYWLLHPTVISVGLVVIGLLLGSIWILAVNVLSLASRVPPSNGSRAVNPSFRPAYLLSKIASLFIWH